MQHTELASTFPQQFAQTVASRGDHIALITTKGSLTYKQLDNATERVACALLSQGAGKGTRVALMAQDGELWITTFLACLRIGALITAVSTLCTPRELAHILRNSDIQFFIGTRGFLNHDYAAKLTAAFPDLDKAKAGGLQLPEAPYLRSIWLDDSSGLDWAEDFSALLDCADAAGAPNGSILKHIEEQVVPTDDAVVVYTSGSTSMPKAVVHSQWNITRHPPELAKLFLLKPDDRMMPCLPAFWLGGMAMAMEVLCVGATLVYPSSPATEDILEAIQQHKVNRLNSWGDMLVKLREAAVERGIDVDAIVGLAPFRDKDGELIPPALQSNMLGMSETFAPHSAEPLDFRLPEDKAGASGRTVNGYERRLVDPDTGKEVAPGEAGELQLRGGALLTGFYKVDRRKVFTEDGFYPTGDLVRVDEDGFLYFIARLGDMIKTKAANVSRLEVEAAMRELPGIELPVVAGLDDPELGQRVVAAVVPKPGTELTEEGLQAALKESLSSYKIPKNIVFITEQDIPRTSTGKIKLFELADLIGSRIQ